jgi:hypothetical protein
MKKPYNKQPAQDATRTLRSDFDRYWRGSLLVTAIRKQLSK